MRSWYFVVLSKNVSKPNYFLGLDFGTTSLSAVLWDKTSGLVKKSISLPHDAYIEFPDPWRKEQDLQRLERCLFEILDKLFPLEGAALHGIGLTGQMHGIIGLNPAGTPVTNLVTWQDDSGNQVRRHGKSLLEEMEEVAPGLQPSAGYGLVTLFKWSISEQRDDIATFCTVPDYFGMLLCDKNPNLIDASMAQSVGAFDVFNNSWRSDLIKQLDLQRISFPTIVDRGTTIGIVTHSYFEKMAEMPIRVAASIGDNQGSFLGSVDHSDGAMLINIGTGTQTSIGAHHDSLHEVIPYVDGKEIELRPLIKGKYLFTVNLISGGTVYDTLYGFFQKCGSDLFDAGAEGLWERMAVVGPQGLAEKEPLSIKPLFGGTRGNPSARGKIENINLDNLTPENLIYGTLKGISELLKAAIPSRILEGVDLIVGSGNGLKKNPLLQELIGKAFGKEFILSQTDEEAAVGAAKWVSDHLTNE